jgi:hypothetical protein
LSAVALVKVTETQVVAAILRTIASQLIKLAQKLDDEAMAGQPVPQKKPRKKESFIEFSKRMTGGQDAPGTGRQAS